MNLRDILDWPLQGASRCLATLALFLKKDDWKHPKTLIVITGIAAAVVWLDSQGAFRQYENVALDIFLDAQTATVSDHIVLITIDDNDYRTLFDATSPLDRDRLFTLLAAIDKGNPTLIGVDIDTASLIPDDQSKTLSFFDKTIWAYSAHTASLGGGDFYCIDKIMGQYPSDASPQFGLALIPWDSDGIIRRYQRTLPAKLCEDMASDVQKEVRQWDSFPWAMFKYCVEHLTHCKANKASVVTSSGDNTLILNFAGNRYQFATISASQVLQFSANSNSGWTSENGAISNKIVLLGGTYRAARDEYVTPLGITAGVEIMAQALQMEMLTTGIGLMHKSLKFLSKILIDIAIGIFLVFWFYFCIYKLHWPVFLYFVSTIFFFVSIPLLVSLGIYNTTAHWLSFVSFMVAILIHQFFEYAHCFAQYYNYKLEESKHKEKA